ncbi:hypothetical protein CXQ80_11085 [Pseudomonas sp. 02C 26]|uniref:hypothetical protein n=1 Tax=Pseudomonas sp. 02C 26 TaxID=2054914 RepID=UPI000C6EF69F|nr:hypothetical protein [Pseudomonas sp. 02C 26]AUF96333.1 hypothetical protein CXQ80_11085 [Pseudomonas sp. 02C 26]
MRALFEKENFILAALPVIAFILALAFEAGIADAYSFSYAFISIDLKVMSSSLFLTALFAFPLYLYLRFLIALISSKKGSERWVGFPFALMLPFIIFCYLSAFDTQAVALSIVLVAGYICIAAITLIISGFKSGWKNAVQSAATSEGFKDIDAWTFAPGPPTIKDKLITDSVIAAFFVLVFGLVHGAGETYAKLRTSYDVLTNDSKQFAILAGYGDRLILGGVKDGVHDRTIAVISLTSDALKDIQRVRLENFLSREERKK